MLMWLPNKYHHHYNQQPTTTLDCTRQLQTCRNRVTPRSFRTAMVVSMTVLCGFLLLAAGHNHGTSVVVVVGSNSQNDNQSRIVSLQRKGEDASAMAADTTNADKKNLAAVSDSATTERIKSLRRGAKNQQQLQRNLNEEGDGNPDDTEEDPGTNKGEKAKEESDTDNEDTSEGDGTDPESKEDGSETEKGDNGADAEKQSPDDEKTLDKTSSKVADDSETNPTANKNGQGDEKKKSDVTEQPGGNGKNDASGSNNNKDASEKDPKADSSSASTKEKVGEGGDAQEDSFPKEYTYAAIVAVAVIVLLVICVARRRRGTDAASRKGYSAPVQYQGVSTNDVEDEEWGWEDENGASNTIGEVELQTGSKKHKDSEEIFPTPKTPPLQKKRLAHRSRSGENPVADLPVSAAAPAAASGHQPSSSSSQKSGTPGGPHQAQTSNAGTAPSQPLRKISQPSPTLKPIPPPPDDDIFSSMGLAAKPTFHKPATRTTTPAATTTTTTSRWGTSTTTTAAATAVVGGAVGGSLISGMGATTAAVKADDLGLEENWDDDADLDDLLDD